MPLSRRPSSWLSARAFGLHCALALALPLCGIAAWWQVNRALSGNPLSWLYVFEWPAFAFVAAWFWWVLLSLPVTPRAEPPGRAGTDLRWDRGTESAALQAYNRFLADLNEGRSARRPHRRLSR